jgi:hypothetical protein
VVQGAYKAHENRSTAVQLSVCIPGWCPLGLMTKFLIPCGTKFCTRGMGILYENIETAIYNYVGKNSRQAL